MCVLAQAENDMVKRALRKARARQLSFEVHIGERHNLCRFGKQISNRSDEVSLLFGAQELSARCRLKEKLRMPSVGIDKKVEPLCSDTRQEKLRAVWSVSSAVEVACALERELQARMILVVCGAWGV